MLHILFLILKIIGIVLLAVLGLLLAAVLLVLLVPIRYRAEGSWHGAPAGQARITWLLHAVSVLISYGEDGLGVTAKVLGFPVFRMTAGEGRKDGEGTAAEEAEGVAGNKTEETAGEEETARVEIEGTVQGEGTAGEETEGTARGDGTDGKETEGTAEKETEETIGKETERTAREEEATGKRTEGTTPGEEKQGGQRAKVWMGQQPGDQAEQQSGNQAEQHPETEPEGRPPDARKKLAGTEKSDTDEKAGATGMPGQEASGTAGRGGTTDISDENMNSREGSQLESAGQPDRADSYSRNGTEGIDISRLPTLDEQLRQDEAEAESGTSAPAGENRAETDKAETGSGPSASAEKGAADTEFDLFALPDSIMDKIESIVDILAEKLEWADRKRRWILHFLEDPKNRKTILLVWRQLTAILRHLLPQKASGEITVGFDDPATTGQVLAICSVLFAVYGAEFTVTPDFENAVIDGDVRLKGRICIGVPVTRTGRVLIDRNLWRMIKNIRKFLGSGGK